jgi:hypothetical protein
VPSIEQFSRIQGCAKVFSIVGLTFTVFVCTVTFVESFSGCTANAFGPLPVSLAAAILVGLGLRLPSRATSAWEFYQFLWAREPGRLDPIMASA